MQWIRLSRYLRPNSNCGLVKNNRSTHQADKGLYLVAALFLVCFFHSLRYFCPLKHCQNSTTIQSPFEAKFWQRLCSTKCVLYIVVPDSFRFSIDWLSSLKPIKDIHDIVLPTIFWFSWVTVGLLHLLDSRHISTVKSPVHARAWRWWRACSTIPTYWECLIILTTISQFSLNEWSPNRRWRTAASPNHNKIQPRDLLRFYHGGWSTRNGLMSINFKIKGDKCWSLHSWAGFHENTRSVLPLPWSYKTSSFQSCSAQSWPCKSRLHFCLRDTPSKTFRSLRDSHKLGCWAHTVALQWQDGSIFTRLGCLWKMFDLLNHNSKPRDQPGLSYLWLF